MQLVIICALVLTVVVVLHLSFEVAPRNSSPVHLNANQLANINCPSCVRPVCQAAAEKASCRIVSRDDPEWPTMDKSDWTPRQRVASEAVWIDITCPFCNGDFTVDDLGVLVAPASPNETILRFKCQRPALEV